ncbi:hypothetical protein [Thermoclostridium stercorarium]|uniref:hypothetical protein n=1 Tax=Thermoclostridium stercorarium TaxID=1510 RepID=UPI000A6FEC26
MTGKTGFGEKVFNVINTLIMIFVIIITLYPMMHVLFASFSDGVELMMHRGVLLHPLGFTTDAYKLVFDNPILLNGYINTITLVLVGVTVNIILTSITAYFVSRKNVMWNRLMMFLIVITMYFNGGSFPII